MIKRLLGLALFTVAVGLPQTLTINPPNWTGTSGVFTLTFSNPLPTTQINYYYITFDNPGTSLQSDVLRGGACTFIISHSPGMSFVQPAPISSYDTHNGSIPNGVFTPLEPGFWTDYGPVSNSYCQVNSYSGGSSIGMSNGNLVITLSVSFQPGFSSHTYEGLKNVWFGSRTQYGDGPFWVGPLLYANDGSPSNYRVATPPSGTVNNPIMGTTTTGGDGFPVVIGDDYSPTASIQKTTPIYNMARGRVARQSSNVFDYCCGSPYIGLALAGLAVDGQTNGNFSLSLPGTVTHTDYASYGPWWQVDLGASSSVDHVTIWNRADCCGDRLQNYYVFVSDTPFGDTDSWSQLTGRANTWYSYQTAIPSPTATIPVGYPGRYVRIQLTATNQPLSLAEVQVWGQQPYMFDKWVVGDTYNYYAHGPANGTLVMLRRLNGADGGTLTIPLDINGEWIYNGGVVQPGEVGDWEETSVINGYVTRTIKFTVYPY